MSDSGTDKVALRWRWRHNWLRAIREFAEADNHCRMWLDSANSNPHFSFAELNCCYFDDLGLDLGYDRAVGEGLLAPEEAEAVARFHAKASAYRPANSHDHQAILSDPEWATVVDAAQQTCHDLAALLNDPAERALLGA